MIPIKKETSGARASLELLYNISRELAAALDLPTVLRRVLFLSVQNVAAISGSIIVLDDNGLPVESALIVREQVHDHTTRQLKVTLERGLAGWVARNRKAALVSDTSQDERWVRRPDDAQNRTGAKSAVGVPILVRENLVGVMTLVHPTPGTFTEDHMALIQTIADQAGFAILNARLYAESQRQARVMTAVAESTAVITASLKLDDVLQHILEQISQALRVEAVFLALIEPQSKELEFRASTTNSGRVLGVRIALGQGIAGWVAQEGRGIIVPDVTKDRHYNSEIGRLLGINPRALACAPIRSLGQVIGVVEAINPQGGYFDADALLVLSGIGGMAGTAIRHAQLYEGLQVAHQRYRDLFEDSIDPILVTDWDGNILEANRQAELTTGCTRSLIQQANIQDLGVVNIDRLGPGFSALTSGSTLSYEAVLFAQNGQEIPVQVYTRMVMIDEISHLQWILRDITERKELDSLRDDLISMIYHDLRSPLANVVSSLDVLATAFPLQSEPAFKSLLNIAVRSTERIQRLTNSLLDINRLEAGQPIVNQQEVLLQSLVTDVVDAITPISASKGQEVVAELPADLPACWIDVDMIRRVLINLMENAVKFTPTGGKVTIGGRQQDEFLEIWVEDTGPGIPPSEREHIFDKFIRLNSKDGPRGLGLGLAFCQLAIIGHGGKIWVESGPDFGSRFYFTLPVAKSD